MFGDALSSVCCGTVEKFLFLQLTTTVAYPHVTLCRQLLTWTHKIWLISPVSGPQYFSMYFKSLEFAEGTKIKLCGLVPLSRKFVAPPLITTLKAANNRLT